jgi:hypothetical protein
MLPLRIRSSLVARCLPIAGDNSPSHQQLTMGPQKRKGRAFPRRHTREELRRIRAARGARFARVPQKGFEEIWKKRSPATTFISQNRTSDQGRTTPASLLVARYTDGDDR